MPIPVGQNRFQQRPHLGGGLIDLGLQASDFFFGLVPLDVPFQSDLLTDRLDRFGIGFIGQGLFDDRFQLFDRGLRQSFFHSFVNLLPKFIPRPGGGNGIQSDKQTRTGKNNSSKFQ